MGFVVPAETSRTLPPDPLVHLRQALEELADAVLRVRLPGTQRLGASLRSLMQRVAQGSFSLMVAAESEAAKANVLRALLGPSDSLGHASVSSTTCTYMAYGAEPDCAVELEHGLTASFAPEQIAEFLARKGVSAKIRRVVLRSPHPLLKSGLVVIDAPVVTEDTDRFLQSVAPAQSQADLLVYAIHGGHPCGEATLRVLRALRHMDFVFVLAGSASADVSGQALELRMISRALEQYGGIAQPRILMLPPETSGHGERYTGASSPEKVEFQRTLLGFARGHLQQGACAEALSIVDEVVSRAKAATADWKISPLRRSRLRRELVTLQQLRARIDALTVESRANRSQMEADALRSRRQAESAAQWYGWEQSPQSIPDVRKAAGSIAESVAPPPQSEPASATGTETPQRQQDTSAAGANESVPRSPVLGVIRPRIAKADSSGPPPVRAESAAPARDAGEQSSEEAGREQASPGPVRVRARWAPAQQSSGAPPVPAPAILRPKAAPPPVTEAPAPAAAALTPEVHPTEPLSSPHTSSADPSPAQTPAYLPERYSAEHLAGDTRLPRDATSGGIAQRRPEDWATFSYLSPPPETRRHSADPKSKRSRSMAKVLAAVWLVIVLVAAGALFVVLRAKLAHPAIPAPAQIRQQEPTAPRTLQRPGGVRRPHSMRRRRVQPSTGEAQPTSLPVPQGSPISSRPEPPSAKSPAPDQTQLKPY